MAKVISLANGGQTLVSDEDYHWLSQRRWHRNNQGYAACSLWGRRSGQEVLMHRLILLAADTASVDHANRNKLDNQRENLRFATQSQQNANRAKITGRSRFKGVHRRWDGLKWVAQIKDANHKTIHLGSFASEVEAANAYNAAAIKRFGEFAYLNSIPKEKS